MFGALLGEAGDQIGGRRSCIDVMEAAEIVPIVSRRTDERIRASLGFESSLSSHVESVSETLKRSNVSETLGFGEDRFGDVLPIWMRLVSETSWCLKRALEEVDAVLPKISTPTARMLKLWEKFESFGSTCLKVPKAENGL